jgi:hypothetical protein
MALQTSGAISLGDIHAEAGGGSTSVCTINDSDIRALIGASSEATMDFDDWYGASASSTGSGDDDGEGCLLYGTLIDMADGTQKVIEDIVVGDKVVSYNINGLGKIEKYADWYQEGAITGSTSTSTVVSNILDSYNYYFLINNIIKATFEQPFLISNEKKYFTYARDIKVGDYLFNKNQEWIKVESKVRVDENIQTAVLDVEEVDNYYAEGFLTHNIKELKFQE